MPSVKTTDNGNGTYTIKLKAGTNSVIFYTTDGSTPTANDNLYKGEFIIEAEGSIRAIAVCPSGRKSKIENYHAPASAGVSPVTADNIPCFTD